MLLLAPEYSLDIQAQIPTALCAIHNFIHIHDSDEGELLETRDLHNQDHNIFSEVSIEEEEELGIEMSAKWYQIAQAMWLNYQQVLIEADVQDFDPLDDELSDEVIYI